MMKRTFFTAALATALAVSPAMAQQAQHQHGTTNTEAGQPDHPAGMMMGSQAMREHQQKMEEMRALVQKARAATAPAERQRLMAEHQQKMQEHMASMMQATIPP